MTTTVDLSRYITDSMTTGLSGVWYLYAFPNGRSVSVIPDPTRPLRFEIKVDGERDPEPGLSTAKVEARLLVIRSLPPAADDELLPETCDECETRGVSCSLHSGPEWADENREEAPDVRP